MAVSQTQLDHFLDFITSTHVIQDLPFEQKSIKLSTKEVIRVLNVIRMMVPESIVKQYFAYSSESGFTTLSRTIRAGEDVGDDSSSNVFMCRLSL